MGFGNIVNFDQDAWKTVWHSSCFHSTSHCVAEQRWSVHTFKLKLTDIAVTSDASCELLISCHNVCNRELQNNNVLLCRKFTAHFYSSSNSVKLLWFLRKKKQPYLAWDMHALTLNMGVTCKPRDARFQYAYSFQNWQQTL